MTIEDIFRVARQKLQHLYPEQEINAMSRLLLQHYAGLTTAQLYAAFHDPLPESCALHLTDALSKLSMAMPLQYVIGETEFCGLPFEVNEHVLIPRPETEELVYWALDELRPITTPKVLDLCTGSGCIVVALARLLPQAQVAACDISLPALALAQRNAQRNKAVVDFFEGDILNTDMQNSLCSERLSVHCLISNPPYIRDGEKNLMHQNVLSYEPHNALFVPDHDPLIFYRAIAAIACRCLAPGGFIMVEINETLATETMQLFHSFGFTLQTLRQDIHGKNRMIKAEY